MPLLLLEACTSGCDKPGLMWVKTSFEGCEKLQASIGQSAMADVECSESSGLALAVTKDMHHHIHIQEALCVPAVLSQKLP